MLVLDRLIGLASPEAALRRAVRLSEQGKAAEAFPLLTRSAKAGIADAEYRVACCYLEGAGVPASAVVAKIVPFIWFSSTHFSKSMRRSCRQSCCAAAAMK